MLLRLCVPLPPCELLQPYELLRLCELLQLCVALQLSVLLSQLYAALPLIVWLLPLFVILSLSLGYKGGIDYRL